MGTQHQTAIIPGGKLLFHKGRPKNPRCSQLGNLHKEVHTNSKKER